MSMKEIREMMIEDVYTAVYEGACDLERAAEYDKGGLFDSDSYQKLHEEFCKKHIRPEGLRNKYEEEAYNDSMILAYQSHKDGFMAGFKVAMALMSGDIDFEEVQGNAV